MSKITEVLINLTIYIHPEYFEKDYKKTLGLEGLNIRVHKRYYKLISSIDRIFKKIQRYEIYFSEFYPHSENIPVHEALEHNIHSYLGDLTILRNDLRTFLNSLKHDIKKVASNEKEIGDHFDGIEKKIEEIFKKVKDHRDLHQHRGKRFLDSDIVDIKMMDALVSSNSVLQLGLLKAGALEEIEKRKNTHFEMAKKGWIVQARNNGESITILIEDLFSLIENAIYKLLKMKVVFNPQKKN